MAARDADTAEVSQLVEELERAVLDGLRVPLAVAAASSTIYFAWEWFRGLLAPLQVVQWLTFIGLAVLARVTLTHRWRKSLFVIALAVQPICALFHYGPLLGTGVFATGALLGGTFFFGARGGYLAFAAAVAAMASCAALSLNGLVTPGHAPLEMREWFRIISSSSFALALCGYLFLRITIATRASFAHLVSARREKESAQLSAQRLESLGRLAGGIAHELNNALQVIESGAGLLRASSSSSADTDVLDDIGRAVVAASSTSHRLLAFGRSRPEDAGRCSPSSVVASFASSSRRSLPASTAIVVNADPGAPDIGLAPPALEEVLTNLVANAVDAMPAGGAVTLDVSRVGDDVIIGVSDTGAGVAADIVDRVFEPFFSTRPGQSGLGLAAVWGIVTRVGGKIAHVDGVQRGARFEMRFHGLPALAAVATPAATPATMSVGPRRLLLLEDEPDIARVFVRVLQRGGYEVTAFERVAPALAALSAEGAHFDGLMTDVVVPGGGVAGLIETFRARFPGRPVLVCSGHVEEDLVTYGIARGEFRFLRKPFAGTDLISTLAELFDSRRPPAPGAG